MKDLADEQRKQMETQKKQMEASQVNTQLMEEKILHKLNEKIEEKVQRKVEERLEEVSQDSSFQSLKDQAFTNRHNLIVTGLEEDDSKTPAASAEEVFKTMGVDKSAFKEAWRIGQQPQEDSSYCRPVGVKFKRLDVRNKIWRKRTKFSPEGEGQKIRIQADLPKKLREEINILYRIQRAAAKHAEYKSLTIRNFAIQLQGKEYTPARLENLPRPIRPSTISNPRSEDALVFFTKYSVLSNHHPSIFLVNNQEFHNMEHYLAYQKAVLSGRQEVITRAQQSTDAKEAKAILNSLKDDHSNEWNNQVEESALEGLRAKFSQNPHLLVFLRETGQLQLGEASPNERWGIGMDLNDPNVLDTTKWNPTGNLLGRCLMKIREELCYEK